jgi:hypothetical protein
MISNDIVLILLSVFVIILYICNNRSDTGPVYICYIIMSITYTCLCLYFPIKKLVISIESNSCIIERPICYGSFHQYYKLECKHCYCLGCLDKWMDVDDRCPYCRNPF